MLAAATEVSSRVALRRAIGVGLGATLLLYVMLEFVLTRGTTVFLDEISLFQQDVGLHPSALLAPFNEHLDLTRRLLYALGFKLFGARSTFLVAKIVQAVGVVLAATAVFVFVTRRVGAAAGLAATLVVVFFGSAWELDFAISGFGNVLALAAGIGALMALEARRPWTDWLACLLLVVATASFTAGTAFALGALWYLLVDRGSRRRAWVAVVPLLLFAAWLLWVRVIYVPAHGNVQTVTLSNVLLIPNEIAQQAAATAGALSGTNYAFVPSDVFGGVFSSASEYGGVLALLAAGALIWRMRARTTPMLWGLVATLLAYWVELALGFGTGRNPTTVRYVYFAGTVALLVAAEASGKPIARRSRLLVIYGLAAFALLGNLARLRDGMHFYRVFGTAVRAQFTALETAAPSLAPGFQATLGNPPLAAVTASDYLAAVRRNGSPAYTEPALRRQSTALRQLADSVLVSALRIKLEPLPGGQALHGCLRRSGDPGGSLTLSVRPPGLKLRADAGTQVSLGQYSRGVVVGSLSAGGAVELRIPVDRSVAAWSLTLNPGPAQLALCAL